MTSQNVEIQALINGIDELLSKSAPRLPWVMSNDALQQRQVLEQARQYLASQVAQTGDTQTGAIQAETAPPPSFSASPADSTSAESAQQVLQAVLQEMNYWRVNMLQPLRVEIDSLQRQRELLSQELRQLEARQQTLSGASNLQNQQLIEFLQAAMNQMQANLSNQVTQMVANLPQSGIQPGIQPSQALLMQAQSDQLMLRLDSTLQIIFESLNRNVQTYQESMEQGLGRMHHLGQQGEAMFSFLVNRLAQQLGREATSFLQSGSDALPDPQANPQSNQRSSQISSQFSSQDSSSPYAAAPATALPSSNLAPQPDSAFKVADFLSQVPQSRSAASFVPAVPFNLLEEVLDIGDLVGDLDSDLDSDLDGSSPETAFGTGSADRNAPNAQLNAQLSAELSQLELLPHPEPHPSPAAELLDLFSGTVPLPAAAMADPAMAGPPESLAAVSQTDAWVEPSIASSDLESALDLLNQLSAEMQTEIGYSTDQVDGEPYGDSVADLATDLATAPELPRSPDWIASPDSLYEDTFYSDPFRQPAATAPAAALVDGMTLEQDWFDGLGDPASQLEAQPSTQSHPTTAPISQPTSQPLESADAPIPQPSESVSDFDQSLQTLIQQGALEAMPVSEAPDEAGLDLGMTLDSLASLGSPAAPKDSEVPSWPATAANPPAVTIEGLEELFADLPDVASREAANRSQVEVIADLFSQIGAADPTPETTDLASAPEAAEKKNL